MKVENYVFEVYSNLFVCRVSNLTRESACTRSWWSESLAQARHPSLSAMCTSSSPSTTELPSASTSHSRSSTGTLAPSSDSNSGILQVTGFLSSWTLKIWSKVFLKLLELFLQCIQLKLHIHYYSFFNHYRYFYFSVTNMKGGKCRMNLALFLSKAAALKKGSSNYSTTTNSDCVYCFI